MFNDKTILVTGGTGSFGRAFVKRVLNRYAPKRLIVYSRDEQKHYEMSGVFRGASMRYFVGDVRDRDRLCRAMEGVDYCVHAAAMKHGVGPVLGAVRGARRSSGPGAATSPTK